jgi:CheY-like chemotaxis protein
MIAESIPAKLALVVEDEADFAAMIQKSLEDAGLRVIVAHDGARALSLALEARPDVVTLDIQMPRETGIWFYRSLRAAEEGRDIPVVVITGLTPGDPDMRNIISTFLERDGIRPPHAYLEKPVSRGHLLVSVQSALDSSAVDPGA